MTEEQDPLVEGLRSAVVHMGKAGFEILAAAGAVAKGVANKVRPQPESDDPSGGRERIPVD